MRYSYAKEKFGVAVNALATGTGDIRERIWDAYLSFHTLSEKDFPEDLKADWNFICKTLTKEEPSYNDKGEVTVGSVQNTLKRLDIETCVKIAQKICDLDFRLSDDE